jgi:hypothetical protein
VAYFEQTRFDPETDIYTESDLIADRIEEERESIIEKMNQLPVTFHTPGVTHEASFWAGYEKAWLDILEIVKEVR